MRILGFIFAISSLLVACGPAGPLTPPGTDAGLPGPDGSVPEVVPAGCTGVPGTALAVTGVVPTDGSTDVDVASQVFVSLNRPLNLGSVDAQSVVLRDALGGDSGAAVTYVPSTCTLILTVDGGLQGNETYTVELAPSLVSMDGHHLDAAFQSSFHTAPSPSFSSAPPLVYADPPGGLFASPQVVTLTCDPYDNCSEIRFTTDGTRPGPTSPLYSGPITIDGDTLVAYYATDDLRNVVGRTVVQSYIIDLTPPTLESHIPASGATNVLHDAVIELQFDEPMDPTTLDANTVTVEPGVAGAIAYDIATHRLVFTPYERLDCGETFTVTVTTGATDLAGNPFASDATFSFDSHPDCPPPHTTASVPGGPYRATQDVSLSCDDGAGAGCARIRYTLDGSVPSPSNGVTVEGASVASVPIPIGETTLLYYAEDLAGNREVMRRQHYSVSTTGFAFHGEIGVTRGVGPTPTEIAVMAPESGGQGSFAYDAISQRLYYATQSEILASDDDGAHWFVLTTDASSFVEPHNEVIYAGASLGLMVSTDGGGTFTLRDGAPGEVTRHGRDVYGYDSPLQVSHDKGYTWETRDTTSGLASAGIARIIDDGTRIYIATWGGGLAVSDDRGASFAMRTTADGLPSDTLYDLDVDGTTVYAATDTGLAISFDGGDSFTAVRTTADGLGDLVVRAVRASGNVVLALTGVDYLTAAHPVAVSLDGGASFTSPTVTVYWDLTPTDVYMHGGSIYVSAYPAFYVSDDLGATFRLGAASWGPVTDIRCHAGSVYAAIQDSSGHPVLMISSDLGESWRYAGRENGLTSSFVNDFYVGPEGLFLATQNGLGISQDDGQSFTVVGEAEGIGHFDVSTVDVQAGQIYTGSYGIDVSSDLTGASFSPLYAALSPIRLRIDGTRMYALDRSASDAIQVSIDSGASFVPSTVMTGAYGMALDVDGSGTVYAGLLNDGVYASTDFGATWAPTGVPQTTVSYIQAQGDYVFAGITHGVSTSTDGGASFTTLDYSSLSYGFTYGGLGGAGCYVP